MRFKKYDVLFNVCDNEIYIVIDDREIHSAIDVLPIADIAVGEIRMNVGGFKLIHRPQ